MHKRRECQCSAVLYIREITEEAKKVVCGDNLASRRAIETIGPQDYDRRTVLFYEEIVLTTAKEGEQSSQRLSV